MLLKDIIDNWKKPLNFIPERVIDQPTLEKIIEAARWAPSAENQQGWKFLIITDVDKKKIIEKSVGDQDPRLSSSSHSIEKPILKSNFTFSIENYNAKTDKYRNEIGKFHNEEVECVTTCPCIIICTHSKKYLGNTFGLTDIGASIDNMLLICEELGLKLRWIRNFNRELIREKFDIPKSYSIDALLAIGDSKETHPTPEYQLKNTQDFFGYNDFNEDFPDINIFSDSINIPTYKVRAKDAILDRRSIRDFKENKRISKEIIYSLLKASMMVPLTINKPYLRFIIIDDQEKLKKIAETAKIVIKQSHVQQVPLIFIATYNCSNNSPAFYAESDTGAILQNQLLRAHSMGIGSCWIGAFSRNSVKKILNIPDDWHIPTIAIFGYPNNYPRPTPRKKIDRIAYLNQWDRNFTSKKQSFLPNSHFLSIGIRKLKDTHIKSVLRKRKVGIINNIPEFQNLD